MNRTILSNVNFDGKIVDIAIADGIIEAIGTIEKSASDEIIDAQGLSVYYGLFDIHTHGCDGKDTMDFDLAPLCRFWAKHGTTMFLPTTSTESHERLYRSVCAEIPTEGAKIGGFHLEGPYINSTAIGAQNPAHVRALDLEEFRQFPNTRLVTIAPELEGAQEFIRNCGAVVALGHTKADYNASAAAIRAGARCLTHTCNAMPPFLHRDPGPIGAALTEDAYVQVISDGIHLHPAMVMGLYRMFGAQRMILISDSIQATGLADGNYELGGLDIFVRDGVARIENGALAGSTSTLYHCVKQAISFGIPATDAFRMASRTPAELLGIDYGEIKVGAAADLLLVDENYDLKRVLINGKTVE